MKKRALFYILLFLFNLCSLYFIMKLFAADQLVRYVLYEDNIIESPRLTAYILYVCCLSNLYFQFFTWMEYFFKDEI